MYTLLLICLIAGCAGGFLQGILGVGTGIIVVPLLTFLLPHFGVPREIDIHIAVATSMAIIVVSSISSLISHHKQENIRWDIFWKVIFFSITGSLIGAILAGHLSASLLKVIFALFMFFTAYKVLTKKNTHINHSNHEQLSPYKLSLGGTVIGVLASLVGMGGSLLMVPFLHAQKLQMRYAVGTSTLIGLPVAITGAIVFIFTGLKVTAHLPMMLGYIYWPAFLSISVGAIIFSYLGAKIIKSIPVLLLQRMFAFCVTIMGVKMLF